MSFLEVFSPGMQHLREERDRRKMLVVRPAYGGGGKPLGIDLEAGTATFARPQPKGDPAPDPGSDSTSDEDPGSPATDDPADRAEPAGP